MSRRRRALFCLLPLLMGAASLACRSAHVMVRDVTVIDGSGAPPRAHMTVVIEGARIIEVGPVAAVVSRAGAEVVDGRGRYLMPGLMDAHVHLHEVGRGALALYAAAGVTTVRDMGTAMDSIRALRAAIAEGALRGPRVLASGAAIEDANWMTRFGSDARGRRRPNHVLVADASAAVGIVDSLARAGADFIKIRNAADAPTFFAIARAARARGLALVGHAIYSVDPATAADSGQRSFEHAFYPDGASRMRRDSLEVIIASFRRNRIAQVPTLATWQQRRTAAELLLLRVSDSALAHDPRTRLVSPLLIAHWREELLGRIKENDGKPQSAKSLASWGDALDRMGPDLAVLHRAGVTVLVGSDLPNGRFPGDDTHEEMQRLASAVGLSPMDVLVAATSASARFFGMADSVGTIAPGMIADLVLLRSNPVENIANVATVVRVWLRGQSLVPAR